MHPRQWLFQVQITTISIHSTLLIPYFCPLSFPNRFGHFDSIVLRLVYGYYVLQESMHSYWLAHLCSDALTLIIVIVKTNRLIFIEHERLHPINDLSTQLPRLPLFLFCLQIVHAPYSKPIPYAPFAHSNSTLEPPITHSNLTLEPPFPHSNFALQLRYRSTTIIDALFSASTVQSDLQQCREYLPVAQLFLPALGSVVPFTFPSLERLGWNV